jgi:hypothetical protein
VSYESNSPYSTNGFSQALSHTELLEVLIEIIANPFSSNLGRGRGHELFFGAGRPSGFSEVI